MKQSWIRLIHHASRVCMVLLAVATLMACAQPSVINVGQTVAANPTQATSTTSTQAQGQQPLPLLAYYYIWFDPQSWNRAKKDLPALGPYSSDDRKVMQQHIQWAKQAGIQGFIVSWKSTDTLNRRLKQLIEVANEEDFKLVIIYQGLDFDRNPLPVDRIAADLDYFTQQYANNKAFALFDRPAVIWSGTWKFSREDVAKVTATRRKQLLILASQRNVGEYKQLADIVDGDAYYWSSVNPDTYPGYQEKLDAMAQTVHSYKGLWIAPAAVGFDARMIGGTTTVERKDGEMLRRQMDAAIKSSPDAVGLISWNEFSENSYIEPSQKYGRRYLDVLTEMQGVSAPKVNGDLDSSSPGGTQTPSQAVAPLAVMVVLVLTSLSVITWRALRLR